MTTFLVTTALATVFFLLFGLSLLLGRFFGRKERKCACAQSRVILNQVAARNRNRLRAESYRPESVDTRHLPVVSREE